MIVRGQQVTLDGASDSFNIKEYFVDIVQSLNQMSNRNILSMSSGQILSKGFVYSDGLNVHTESEILDVSTEQWFDDMVPPIIKSEFTNSLVLNRENYLQKFLNDVKIIEEL